MNDKQRMTVAHKRAFAVKTGGQEKAQHWRRRERALTMRIRANGHGRKLVMLIKTPLSARKKKRFAAPLGQPRFRLGPIVQNVEL